MPGRHREANAVAEMQCPRCEAWPGHACFIHGVPGKNARGGPACHQERRTANQERRRALGLTGPIEMPPGTANGPPRKAPQ
jgi:hypothetical protein